MFNVGGSELLIILFVALVVLGPDKLPDAARKIGNIMGEIKRMSAGFQNEVRSAMDTPARIVNETVTQSSAPTSDAPVTDPGAEVAEHQVEADDDGNERDTVEPVSAIAVDAPLDTTAIEPALEPSAIELPTTEAPAIDVPADEAPTVEAPTVEAPTVEAPTVEAPIVNGPDDDEPELDALHDDDDDAAAFAGNPRHGLAP